ncbi:helix-turn-helix domain-containing protein [Bordetella pseudohinzii]|uniref:helix-turn-helix domain-containing protein n=2 Tax=Bordetella pseudohinzii TaxID=1331258 RepID=UPI0022A784DB|nr:XRE family transcriptional regulator [Bordetella pseudohinzii]
MKSKQTNSPFPAARPFKPPARLTELLNPLRAETAQKRSSVAAQLGPQIRSLRMASGISAAALGRTSGVSRSMLSRIEHGLASPSIEALERISQALNVPMSRFFTDQEKRTDCSYVPAGKGLRIEREGVIRGYSYELIGHQLSGNMFVEPYKVVLESEAEPYTTFQHPGIKLIYILSGRLQYQYGRRSMDLGPGDTLLFDATALHGVVSIVEKPVSYLSVVFSLRD